MDCEGTFGFTLSKRLVLHVLDGISLALVLIFQGSVLNYYIIAHYRTSVNPYFWFIADFACLIVFATTLTISYKYLTQLESEGDDAKNTFRLSPKRIMCTKYPTSKLGILPLSYISWFFYSGILLSKVLMIFKSAIPDNLNSSNVFGPQMLQVTIALSGIIFLLLAEGHNSAKRHTLRYEYVTSTCAKTGIEILDSVNILALLLVNETHMVLTYEFEDAVLVLCTLTFLLPALALYKLSLPKQASEQLSLLLKVVQTFLHLILIDIPFLTLRIYMWSHYGHDASIFLMKNVFGILIAMRVIYPDCKELLKKHSQDQYKGASNGYAPSPIEDNTELHNLGKGEPLSSKI